MILRPYPWFAFPTRIWNAIQDAWNTTQAPLPLAAMSAMSVVSTACQDRIRVRRLPGLEGPCNTYLLVLAPSGERKSATDSLFTRGIKKVEELLANEHQASRAKCKAEHAIWTARHRTILRDIEGRLREDEAVDDLQEHLEKLLHAKPSVPRCPQWLLGDATPEAIHARLHKVWPSAALLCDEAGAIFASRTLGNLGLLNQLWDAGSMRIDRVSGESFTLSGATLTVGMMVQPQVMQRFMDKHGVQARSSGFLARFFMAAPISTQGTRFLRPTPAPTDGLAAFEARVVELLQETAALSRRGELKPIVFEFDAEGQAAWNAFHDSVEAELAQNGFLADVADNAAKIAENAARLAAQFHFFEGGEGAIPAATVRQAIEIASWHLLEFKSLFSQTMQTPPLIMDARKLEDWLLWVVRTYPGTTEIRKRQILQYGPNELRRKDRLDPALAVLCNEGKIGGVIRGGTTFVTLRML